jgi:predicted signal transduction protein with EAL and GGDEF domain
MTAAKKIQSALEIPIILDDIEIEIRASIGIALFPDHGATDHELFRRAEVAMYNARS